MGAIQGAINQGLAITDADAKGIEMTKEEALKNKVAVAELENEERSLLQKMGMAAADKDISMIQADLRGPLTGEEVKLKQDVWKHNLGEEKGGYVGFEYEQQIKGQDPRNKAFVEERRARRDLLATKKIIELRLQHLKGGNK